MLDLPAEHPGEAPGERTEPSATAAAESQPTLALKEDAVRSEVRSLLTSASLFSTLCWLLRQNGIDRSISQSITA